MDQKSDEDILKLVTEIVAAYVSKNPVAAADLPALIKSVHATLGGFSGAENGAPARAAGRAGEEIGDARLHRLPGRRQETENAQALSARALWPDAGRLSRQMEPARRLSDDGAQLCRQAQRIRQADRAGQAGARRKRA